MEKHVLTRLKEVEEVVRIYSTFQDNMNLYMVSEYVENGELWA
jgi:serine/threonine protein kinase